MEILSNTAVIDTYSFPVAPSIDGTATSNLANVDIEIDVDSSVFTKTNVPAYITPGSNTVITYSVTNISLAPVMQITVQDSIFNMAGVTPVKVVGGTIVNDILTFDLSLLGTIPPGTTVVATVTLEFVNSIVPDSTLYDTEATANLDLLTIPKTTETKTSKGHLEVNAAIVCLTKMVVPDVATVTAGNLLTFTVLFTNSGNMDAIIGKGYFSDTWPTGALANVTCQNLKFSIIENSITNAETLTIAANSTETLVYSGIAVYI